jgi:hypothetical protein
VYNGTRVILFFFFFGKKKREVRRMRAKMIALNVVHGASAKMIGFFFSFCHPRIQFNRQEAARISASSFFSHQGQLLNPASEVREKLGSLAMNTYTGHR